MMDPQMGLINNLHNILRRKRFAIYYSSIFSLIRILKDVKI